MSPPTCGYLIRQRGGRQQWPGGQGEEEEGGVSVHKTGPGAGGGHAAWPGEMPPGAGQPGSGGDHRGHMGLWGKRREEGMEREIRVMGHIKGKKNDLWDLGF